MNEENEQLAAELKAKWQRRFLLGIDAAMGALILGCLAAANELATDWALYVSLGWKAGTLKLMGKCLALSMVGGGLKVWPTAQPSSSARK